jgi:hypothetical protein
MKKPSILWVVLVLMAIQVGTLTGARADVVGHLTEVTGQVNLMRGGKLPAIPAKLQDGVEPGDVVRTKSGSKAQITFMDNSTMTIAPESKVAIEAYMFEPAQEKRNAVFQLFRGLAYVVVNKVFKVQSPDFIVKTHTAVMGVRGTEFGVRLYPASSTILNFKGILEVGNFSPEVSGLSRKAFKIAFSQGPGAISFINAVLLHAMQGATVAKDLPPATFKVTPGMLKSFMTNFSVLESRQESRGNEGAGTQMTSASGLTGSSGGTEPASHSETPEQGLQSSFLNSPAANPPPPTILPPPPPPSYSFSLAGINGTFVQSAANGASPALFTAGSSGVTLQGDLAAIFPGTYFFGDSSTLTPTSGAFPSTRVSGTYYALMTGSVSGNAGSTLTGSATMQSSYVSAVYTVSNSCTVLVTIDPSGQITYSYTGGVFNSSPSSALAISGTSAGEGSATPVPAPTAEASEPTMTMAASHSSTLLTAAPASANDPADDPIDSPPTTLGTSGFKGSMGMHRRFGFRRDFCSPQNHHGRFEPSRATTLHTLDSLATISRTASMAGHRPTVSSRPMHLGFTLTSTITDPDVPIRAPVIKGKGPSGGVGVKAGTRGSAKTGLARPLTAPQSKSPPAVSGTGHHQNLAGTVSLDPEGSRPGVLKGAHPAIPMGARATPPGSLTASPVSPRPQ